MLAYKIGDYIQNNDKPDIILCITDIDENQVQITPFNNKAVIAVINLYTPSTRFMYNTSINFKMNEKYWMFYDEVRLNYKLLPNFKIIAEFNDDLKELINDKG